MLTIEEETTGFEEFNICITITTGFSRILVRSIKEIGNISVSALFLEENFPIPLLTSLKRNECF